MSTAGGQDQEGTASAVPSWVTLPDDLMSAAELDDMPENRDMRDLMRNAAQRICELEEQVLKLRRAIVGHRGQRDYVGGKIAADLLDGKR